MIGVRGAPPGGPLELRARLYAGDVFLLPPTAASSALVDDVRGLLVAELGDAPREAAVGLPNDELFARIGRLRRALYLEPRFVAHATAIAVELGVEADVLAFDGLRLRVVNHRGHENPKAAPVYVAHRDTWYAHPPGLLTVWIPLDDLDADETFVFYPERFGVPVANDSERFEYGAWVKDGWDLKIGWQRYDAGERVRYASLAPGAEPGPAVGFSCARAERLVFAGAHLHQTLPQARGRARFSVDFRLVHLGDHAAGRGAPDPDNRSRGSAMGDYVRPARGR